MSEEEIIKYLKTIKPKNFNNYKDETPCSLITKKQIKAIQGLLDLYNKEKEKNIAIEIYRKDMPKDTKLIIMRKEDFDRNFKSEYISKDKIKEIIKELDKKSFHNEISFSNYYYKKEILKELLEEGENK